MKRIAIIVMIVGLMPVFAFGYYSEQKETSDEYGKYLIIVDGKEINDIKSISPESIESVTILKDQAAVAVFGEKGRNGVMVIATTLNQSEKVDSRKVDNPLYIVDGKETDDIKNISPESIESITVLKNDVVEKYGEKAKNGVVIITTKK